MIRRIRAAVIARSCSRFRQHSSRQSGTGSTNPVCTLRMSGIFTFWSQDYNDEDAFTQLKMDGYPAGPDGVKEFMAVWLAAVRRTDKFHALKWYFMAGPAPPSELNADLFGTWMMTKNVPATKKNTWLPAGGFIELVNLMLSGDLCGEEGVIGVSCSPKKGSSTLKIRTWKQLHPGVISEGAAVFKHDSGADGQEILVKKWEACA